MTTCEDCGTSTGCLGHGMPCFACLKLLCRKCAGEHALIPFDASRPDESNDLDGSTIQSYCKRCYETNSVLDYTKTYDVYEAATDQPTKVATLLMVHGGGGSRAMFRPHAEQLAKRGYRCILMDLPGHGTLVDTKMTLDSCVDATKQVFQECGLQPETTFYLGASLGAYIGFYICHQLKDRFCGAILLDCGQNVGPDCSLKASAGIFFLKWAGASMSNKNLMNAMLGVTKKSPARYRLVESVFGAGMHFQQSVAQTECMHAVAPANHIPNYPFPVLFFNGSEDYRDSEDKWLALCRDQERSQLHVYEGGDHFFSHDERFVFDMLDRMHAFVKNVVVP